MSRSTADSSSHSRPNYHAVQSLPEAWTIATRQFATITAVLDPHSKPTIN